MAEDVPIEEAGIGQAADPPQGGDGVADEEPPAVQGGTPEQPAPGEEQVSPDAASMGADPGVKGDGDDPTSAKEAESVSPMAVVEALLFSSTSPVNAERLSGASGLDRKAVLNHIKELNEGYAREGRAFQIVELANGFQLLTLAAYFPYIQRLTKTRSNEKLTQASLETLAIIAYKQPIIRADVEAVRGVQSGQIIRNLLDRRLIRVVGRDKRLGHPLLYGTTKKFLEVFGLKSLKDLPTLEELKAF